MTRDQAARGLPRYRRYGYSILDEHDETGTFRPRFTGESYFTGRAHSWAARGVGTSACSCTIEELVTETQTFMIDKVLFEDKAT